MDHIQEAIQVVGGLAAIVVLVVGAYTRYVRKDARRDQLAEELAQKPDRHELTTMSERFSERIGRVESDVKSGLGRIEIVLSEIKGNQQQEHARRSDQIQEVFLELKRIMVDMASMKATVEASARSDKEWRAGIERRLDVVERRGPSESLNQGRRRDDLNP